MYEFLDSVFLFARQDDGFFLFLTISPLLALCLTLLAGFPRCFSFPFVVSSLSLRCRGSWKGLGRGLSLRYTLCLRCCDKTSGLEGMTCYISSTLWKDVEYLYDHSMRVRRAQKVTKLVSLLIDLQWGHAIEGKISPPR